MAANQALHNQLSNPDGRDLRILMEDCAILSELAYQEEDYVQNCWEGNPPNFLNQGIDDLTALLRAEIIVPPGPREYQRHQDLMRRCPAFPPMHYGGDSVMYIFPYQFPSSSRNGNALDIIILAFRGTNSFQSLAVNDVGLPELIDLNWPHIDGQPLTNVKVDLGFQLYLQSLLTDLDKVGSGTLLHPDSTNTELIAALPTKPIICTGHSLGGAASTLAALYLKRKSSQREVGFINMGSPRVGNHHFAQLVNTNLHIKWRVVNGCDPVVALPPNLPLPLNPAETTTLSDWIRNFYYEHVGKEYQISFYGGLTTVPLLDHCIAMYIYHLMNPNSQNPDYGELGVENLQSWFANHLTDPFRHVRFPEQNTLTTECVNQLTGAFRRAANTAETEGGNVASVIQSQGHRVFHFLAEWTHSRL